jgi:hypothetical protein
VKEVLIPYFTDIVPTKKLVPTLLGKPGHKGGNVTLERICQDVSERLKNEKKAYSTTFK